MTVLPSKVTLCDASGNPLVIQAGIAGAFIADPNATPDGNVYAAVANAIAAAHASGRGSVVYLSGDATLAAGEHDITGIKIIGLDTLSPTLTLANGAILKDDHENYYFENVVLSWAGTTVAPITVPDRGATITLGPYASMVVTNTATKGLIETTNGQIYMDAMYSNSIAGSSGHQAIKLGAGAQLLLRIGNFGVLAANTITGGPSGAATITDLSKAGGGAAASISQSQTGLTAATYD